MEERIYGKGNFESGVEQIFLPFCHNQTDKQTYTSLVTTPCIQCSAVK